MPRILITGGKGLLGSTLVPILIEQGHEVLVLGRADADISADLRDANAAFSALDKARPAVVVNLVALTNVDECERNPSSAYRTNVGVVENIAAWVRAHNSECHLVQVSTDHVYDGPGLHTEAELAPLNCYAWSKYAGELQAYAVGATVLRTNMFGRSRCAGRASLSDWVVSRVRAETMSDVFEDVLFSPLSLETLSEMIGLVIDRPTPGIYNLGSHDGMSKADFAFELARTLALDTRFFRRSLCADLKLPTRRPGDMRMDCSRFERTFRVQLPSLSSEINLMRNAYANSNA